MPHSQLARLRPASATLAGWLALQALVVSKPPLSHRSPRQRFCDPSGSILFRVCYQFNTTLSCTPPLVQLAGKAALQRSRRAGPGSSPLGHTVLLPSRASRWSLEKLSRHLGRLWLSFNITPARAGYAPHPKAVVFEPDERSRGRLLWHRRGEFCTETQQAAQPGRGCMAGPTLDGCRAPRIGRTVWTAPPGQRARV